MININKKYTKQLSPTYSYDKPTFIMEAVNGEYCGKIIYPIKDENGNRTRSPA